MRLLLSTILLLASLGGSLQAADHPHWFQDSFLNLQDELEEARSNHKGLLLYFYQQGCPYCERLIGVNFSQRTIVDKTRARYQVVAIDLWGDNELTDLNGVLTTEKAFAASIKVQFTPTLLFLGTDGTIRHRLNGYYPPHQFSTLLDYLEATPQGVTLASYMRDHNPRKSSGSLHRHSSYLTADASLQRQPGGRPLVVLFEQHDCSDCDEMHGSAFRTKEMLKLLQQFDVALIDIWDQGAITTPRGETIAINQWASRLGVNYTPSLLFFDTAGNEIFRSESYVRPFHTTAAFAYVASGAYQQQPEFQRFIREFATQWRTTNPGTDLKVW